MLCSGLENIKNGRIFNIYCFHFYSIRSFMACENPLLLVLFLSYSYALFYSITKHFSIIVVTIILHFSYIILYFFCLCIYIFIQLILLIQC